ncbi:non-ribosomal peptide synthetase [Massilia sp. TWP1-3-3]|uniref:non-ribosomal peptide synthetase n=1 Tax=Massilia sp. TWP1-3-3 TaxID=2804573 RepID=UPI003CF7394A
MEHLSEITSEVAKENKKKLLAELLQRKLNGLKKSAPMSKGQESLWFLYQKEPQSAAYNIASAIRIHSAIHSDFDSVAFNRALNACITRHASLRTTYGIEDGVPVQIVHAMGQVAIEHIDASAWSEAELAAAMARDYQRPFQLDQLPVLRASLYQVAPRACVFLFTVHHIAFDAWSLWILMEELSDIYQAIVAGQPIPATIPSARYQDFSARQEQLLDSAQGRALEHYWTDKLKGEIHPINLHTSKARPAVQSFNGASHYFQLPAELSAQLNALARTRGVTPNTLLLSAYYVLLNRYSGKDDIVVVSPTSGRSQADFARTIGYFVNPVVLRADLAGNPSFATLLEQVNNTVLDALEHQDYPFSCLIEKLKPKRDPSYAPLAQVSFVFQKPQQDQGLNAAWVPGQAGPTIRWAGLDVSQYPVNQQEGQFELELEIVDTHGSFYGIFKYNTDLFGDADMVQLESSLRVMLAALVESVDCPVQLLPILPVEERHRQLYALNATEVHYPAHSTLHQLIEQQVLLSPERYALVFEQETLSYHALNERANRLAHYLIGRGVKANSIVGVCMNRSVDMVVSLLAIIKAGGAYVPLDPAYPVARLAFMLGDIDAGLLLTAADVAHLIPPARTENIIVETLDLDQFASTNPQAAVTAQDAAYMIYTSGSTGNPKGVVNTHAGICNRLLWMQQHYALDESDAVLQKTPFSFDVSVWEFFWPLLCGARLVVARPDGHKDSKYLVDIIRSAAITTLHFVPSMLSMFVADQEAHLCTGVKRVICSGEALSFELQSRFFKKLDAQLHNLYGPTEAAIDVTYWQCRADYQVNVVPIGKPIANMRIHVLDHYMQPVPQGVPGELHIGGVGLARGYHKRDELTREKFVPDPFSTEPGTRLYKSGDLVRYLPDGNIDYLQRIDHQVKLRGFRIELGEVEAVLCSHPAVREAVVMMRKDNAGDAYLVAYVRLEDISQAGVQQEKAILDAARTKMPEYCVPAAVMFLDEIPLSPNGKVDSKALPQHAARRQSHAEIIPPRNDTERKLLVLWRELMLLDTISVKDNFFELGGHSLMAVRLMAAIEITMGQKMPLSSLIKGPTIAQLAQAIDAHDNAASWSSLVAIQEKGALAPLFCIPGGGGNVLYYYPLAQALGEQQPFYAIEAKGLDGVSAPLDSVEAMAEAAIAAIKSVRPEGPYRIGGHCVGSMIAYVIVQKLLAQGDAVDILLVLDAPAPDYFAKEQEIALSDAGWIGVLVGTIAHMTGKAIAIDEAALAQADNEGQLLLLKAALEQVEMVPPEAPVGQIRGLLEVFKINAKIRYRASGTPLPVRVALLRARAPNPHYDYSAFDDAGADLASSSLGWQRYALGPVAVSVVEGDHITMLSNEHAMSLSGFVQTALAAL